MIFHEKFFQCLAGAIPLFLTPQKIGLLKVVSSYATPSSYMPPACSLHQLVRFAILSSCFLNLNFQKHPYHIWILLRENYIYRKRN